MSGGEQNERIMGDYLIESLNQSLAQSYESIDDSASSRFSIAGMGHDVVDCAEFEEQLNLPGSRFERLFSRREIAQCHARSAESGDSYAQHLAARWAGKEAFLKAWSHALAPSCDMPYAIEYFPWESIEIMSDAVHRPSIIISDDVLRRVCDTVGHGVRFHISLSHDGGIASAVVIIEHDA